jgi:hypothetical protein
VRVLAFASVFVCGCSSSPASVRIDGFCAEMETALRDRQVRCACPGPPLDDAAIEARCAALPATTLIEAFDRGELGWNGAIASAMVRRLDGCDPIPRTIVGTDDPILGNVASGDPCRVFTDAWGAFDDCGFGTSCRVPPAGGEARCVAIAAEGESCAGGTECAPGFACAAGEVCGCALPPCETECPSPP